MLVVVLALALTPAASAQAPAAASALKIVDVQFEDYSGAMVPRFEMKAGGEVVLRFGVSGFERLPEKDPEGLPRDRVRLHYEVEITDPQGFPLQPANEGQLETTLGPHDAEWQPRIHWSASVPDYAPSGDYQIQIQVSDQVGQRRAASQKVSFRVRGEAAQPSDGLEIQQFQFGRSENGPWYPEGYFSPGETVHVRYKVAGFRISPGNRVWVEQDWAVLDAAGKVVVARENAVTERSENFYPPRFVSTFFSLKLDDPKPGPYTLRIAVRDRVGEQTISFESHFVLRP